MTAGVVRSHLDVTPAFLTETLRAAGWIGDATVVEVDVSTIGAGQMGICARYDLRLDHEVDGAPTCVVGKFAAEDEQARTFMASSGYPNEVCFYRDFASRVTIRVPRCAHAAIDDAGWFTLLLEDLSPMRPGDQLQGCTVAQVEAAVQELVGLHAPRWDAAVLHEHPQFSSSSSSGLADPEVLAGALQAVVPGFIERYGPALAPAEVDFYERLTTSARGWIEARPKARSLVHSDYRPDNLMFGTDADGRPTVAAVDWQGFGKGCALSDVSFVVGNALTVGDRRAHEERIVRGYHDALVAAGVGGYAWDQCWDEYGRSLLSALMTTIFGAMYGVRSARGDEMFVIMGGRHARQILDLGVDSLLH
ncbi:MAG TPA: phosphotransferase [Acidimicrobiia bacterium]